MKITLANAAQIIAGEEMKSLTPSDRAKLLESDWWSLEPESREFRNLPKRIRDEIKSEVAPQFPDDPIYDKLLVQSLASNYRNVRKAYILRRLTKLGFVDVTVVGREALLLDCMCCKYRTLTRRGEYEICPVCFWEDVGECADDQYISVNRMTLGMARRNYSEFGACNQAAVHYVDPSGPEKYHRMDEGSL